MNRISLSFIAGLVMTQLSFGSPPSLINYQGRLLDANGAPVNGSIDVAVQIFTNSTGGNPVYSEYVGSIAVLDGIYSFAFGEGGLNATHSSQVLGVGNGVQQVFTATVSNVPMVNPSVTISDGAFSWNDVTGSSSPLNFQGSAIHSIGFVAASYLSVPLSAGTTVKVSYAYSTSDSMVPILSSDSSAWLQLVINANPLVPRQKLVSAPYAIVAGNAQLLDGHKASDFALAGSYPSTTPYDLLECVTWAYMTELSTTGETSATSAQPTYMFTEAFTSTGGLNHRVIYMTDGAEEGGVMRSQRVAYFTNIFCFSATSDPEYVGNFVQTNWQSVGSILIGGDKVSHFTNSLTANFSQNFTPRQEYAVFHYSDASQASSSTGLVVILGFIDDGLSISNPFPSRPVVSVDVYARALSFSLYGTPPPSVELCLESFGFYIRDEPTRAVLSIPSSTNVTHALFHPRMSLGNNDSVVCNLVGSDCVYSNIPLNTVVTNLCFVSGPTNLVIELLQSTNNPIASIRISSIALKLW